MAKQLDLAAAQTIVTVALKHAREKKFNPLGVAVLDARGSLKAYGAEDGSSIGRAEIAIGKANGAIMMGLGSRGLEKRGRERPYFIAGLTSVMRGGFVPVAGGVLIRDGEGGPIVGVVGVSGDTSDNDEAAALAGIAAAGFAGDPGAD